MAKLNYWNGVEWVELGAGIISSDSEPTAGPGAIWLDTSDTLYQGTVFEQLENSINGVVNSKGAADGIATLDATGNVPVGQLGNIAVPVTSVASKIGDVMLTKADVGLSNVANILQATTSTYTTTLDTTWTGTEAPFTKTQTVTGILSTDNPIVDVVMSGTYATDTARISAWGNIYRITTSTNEITISASVKPKVALPIQIKVVR